ncbi:MAG: hypothetical protein ACKVOE_02610 [Rickettsiales bacterium]
MNRVPRIYSYVVASDTGLAPNVTGGICTLAVCKPKIREYAQPGDWVLGMSIPKHGRTRVIYAMQVSEKIAFSDFFHDARFQSKKPTHDKRGDNFFHLKDGEYHLAFQSAAHAGKLEALAKDINPPTVLVGEKFWYFGEQAPVLPESLWEKRLALPDARRRGHRVTEDAADVEIFSDWIQQWPAGVHGKPRDLGRSASPIVPLIIVSRINVGL